jgi:hypothetical protein
MQTACAPRQGPCGIGFAGVAAVHQRRCSRARFAISRRSRLGSLSSTRTPRFETMMPSMREGTSSALVVGGRCNQRETAPMTAAPAGAKCLHRCNVNYTRQSTTEANCRDVRLSARILNRSHRPMEEGAQNEHPASLVRHCGGAPLAPPLAHEGASNATIFTATDWRETVVAGVAVPRKPPGPVGDVSLGRDRPIGGGQHGPWQSVRSSRIKCRHF